MPPAGAFTEVSAGGSHTCGLRTDGSVACWGFNGWLEATPPEYALTQVSVAGSPSFCGLNTDNTLTC